MEFISEGEVGARPGPPESTAKPSFDDFYARTRVATVRLAWFMVASRTEAEELTQDAYIELFQQWHTVENPAAFLRTLVVRRCTRARYRRNNERRKLEAAYRRDDPYKLSGSEPEIDGTLAAVRRLKPSHRAVIVLRFYTDMSHAQMAHALNCSEVAVRTRLHRALADLRKNLA